MSDFDNHPDLCKQVLQAVREVAERNSLHIETSGTAVQVMVSALARCALAMARGSDPNVDVVLATRGDNGQVDVSVEVDGVIMDVLLDGGAEPHAH
jgi:hypothetical protein